MNTAHCCRYNIPKETHGGSRFMLWGVRSFSPQFEIWSIYALSYCINKTLCSCNENKENLCFLIISCSLFLRRGCKKRSRVSWFIQMFLCHCYNTPYLYDVKVSTYPKCKHKEVYRWFVKNLQTRKNWVFSRWWMNYFNEYQYNAKKNYLKKIILFFHQREILQKKFMVLPG